MKNIFNSNNLILYGGGDDVYDIDKITFSFLEKNSLILFSPSAKDSLRKQNEYFDFFKNHISQFGIFDIGRLDLDDKNFDENVKLVQKADLIYLGGGNSFLLNKLLNSSKLITTIKERIKNGNIKLAGYSAGAVVMGSNISPVGYIDKELTGISSKGLNLLPWAIFPHYKKDDKEKEFIINSAKNINIPIIALPENSGLVCAKNECKVIGTGIVYAFYPDGCIKEFITGSIILK